MPDQRRLQNPELVLGSLQGPVVLDKIQLFFPINLLVFALVYGMPGVSSLPDSISRYTPDIHFSILSFVIQEVADRVCAVFGCEYGLILSYRNSKIS